MASVVSGLIEHINVDNVDNAIASTAYGYCETAAGTAIKQVDMAGFELKTGVTVHIKFKNSNSASSPKIKFNNQEDSEAIPIKIYGTTAAGTGSETNGWQAGAVVSLTFDGTNWIRDQGYNTNTIPTYLYHYNHIKAKVAITAESLIVGDISGFQKVAAGVQFDITYPIVWCTKAVSSGSTNYANMFLCHYDRNIATGAKAGFTSTANSLIYLIVTISGATATIDSDIITDTLPSTADGKAYILLGKLGNNSTGANYFLFYPNHPIFEFKNGAIRPYEAAQDWSEITSKPTTVSGYGITDAKTVQTAVADPTVPETGTNEANAFIDTISQNTNGEITVTKKNIPLIDVKLPLTSSSTQSIINSRIATIPYADTSNYGVVKVSATGSSTTIPIYIDGSGILQKCSTYAGATKVTLNGTDKGTQDISIYAPTSSGNSGELLISSGANNAPTWTGKGKYFNSNNYWLFNNKIGIGLESPDSNYTLYANGDTYINGVLKSSNDVIFNNANGNTITWTTGSDQIRPFITISKAISGTGTSPIFTFSLSTNGGTSSTNLLQIDNAGNATFNGSLTSTSGQFGNISIGGGNDSNIISSINGKTMVLSPAAGQLLAFQQAASGLAATTRIVLQENTFYPPTNNSVSLGLADNRWKNIYAEELIVIGNSVGVSNSPRALRIFNTSTNYTDIKSQAAANKTFYLPPYNGTGDMYAVHVGGTTAVGDASTPVYVAANGRITKCNATVGSQYQPVYLDQGTFTTAYPVQYLPWSFTTSGHNQILFESNIFGASTYVLSIVVTSGESNLKGPITWETKTTNGTGQLILQTNPAVAGTVNGYILISLGTDLSSTISGTSSTVNI